jgi:hypothetical protein
MFLLPMLLLDRLLFHRLLLHTIESLYLLLLNLLPLDCQWNRTIVLRFLLELLGRLLLL